MKKNRILNIRLQYFKIWVSNILKLSLDFKFKWRVNLNMNGPHGMTTHTLDVLLTTTKLLSIATAALIQFRHFGEHTIICLVYRHYQGNQDFT